MVEGNRGTCDRCQEDIQTDLELFNNGSLKVHIDCLTTDERTMYDLSPSTKGE